MVSEEMDLSWLSSSKTGETWIDPIDKAVGPMDQVIPINVSATLFRINLK